MKMYWPLKLAPDDTATERPVALKPVMMAFLLQKEWLVFSRALIPHLVTRRAQFDSLLWCWNGNCTFEGFLVCVDNIWNWNSCGLPGLQPTWNRNAGVVSVHNLLFARLQLWTVFFLKAGFDFLVRGRIDVQAAESQALQGSKPFPAN